MLENLENFENLENTEAMLRALTDAMYKIMTTDLQPMLNIVSEKAVEAHEDLTHIYLDGFLHGMTTATSMIQNGSLSITTLEIDRETFNKEIKRP